LPINTQYAENEKILIGTAFPTRKPNDKCKEMELISNKLDLRSKSILGHLGRPRGKWRFGGANEKESQSPTSPDLFWV
jgi:hypothetical protein